MKKCFIYLKGYYKEAILAPLFKMLEALFELMVPLAVKQIIDVGMVGGDTKTILLMCGVMIALGIVGLASALCAQYFSAKAAVGFCEKMRSALFAHIQSFSYSKTDEVGTSTLITRLTGDSNSVQTGINMFLRLFMRSPFIVFGAMIMAFTIDVRLALIFAVVIPVLAIVVFAIMLGSMPLYKKSQARLDSVLGKVRSNYTGTRVVRAFNKEEDEIREFDEKHAQLTKIQRFAGHISALMNPLTYVIINIAVILLLHFGAVHVESGTISQGELVALYNYMSQILVELIKLAALIITLSKAAASMRRIADVLEMSPDTSRIAEISSVNDGSAVRFDRVSFRYHETSDPAIHDVSFVAYPGETIGIIGGTGSGKSTLAHLIPGFYVPTEGNVFIDGKNTADYEKEELVSQIGIVPQKASLVKGSVRSNLLWGKEDATDDELWEALRAAQAEDLVKEKAEGLDEPVAQGGANFSGGQRQRLTVARALLRRPRILILDDSASALDYATESKLRRAIRSLGYEPTTFIVSQRASSILHADRILVLDDGAIVGMGTHDELVRSCDVYREIYFSQFPEGGDAQLKQKRNATPFRTQKPSSVCCAI